LADSDAFTNDNMLKFFNSCSFCRIIRRLFMSSNNQLCNNHFRVEWGGNRVGFMEVSGLAMELDVVPFRDGSSPDNSVTLLPGLKHFSPVVLKRGIVKGDNEFFTWMNTVQSGQADRRDVTIALLNGRHEPVVIWRVRNAFPSKLEFAPLNARGSDVATETLTLVHGGLVVEHLP
jgi:phage tail-like protein